MKINIDHILKLARLEIKKEEKKELEKEMSSILDFVKKLKGLNVKKIESLDTEINLQNVMREDHAQISKKLERIKQEEISKKLLDLAPETKGRYIKVKQVM